MVLDGVCCQAVVRDHLLLCYQQCFSVGTGGGVTALGVSELLQAWEERGGREGGGERDR